MGMMFLFVTLWVRGTVPDDVQTTAQGMLRHLSLLFVPISVILAQRLKDIREKPTVVKSEVTE